MKIDLQIGGYGVRVDEPEGHPYRDWPFSEFNSFEAPIAGEPDIQLTVKVADRIPETGQGSLLFDSCEGFWKLFKTNGGYILDCANLRNPSVSRSRTVLAKDFSRGEITVCGTFMETGEIGWNPLEVINPIVEVCLITKLARSGGVLLHSAGVLAGKAVWVFTGQSGAGKSTISDLFAGRDRRVLSDERMILRSIAGELRGFGTPWPGVGRQALNAGGPLAALYAIRHGSGAHAIREISPREFSVFLLKQCFLPHWDKQAMDRTLAFIEEVIDTIGCHELAFLKQPDVVDFLEKNKKELAGVLPA